MTRILVKITVTNRGIAPVTKTVYRGMVVEVAQPSSPYQHAMVIRDYPVTIPPKATVTLYVEAECLNRNRNWPANVAGNLTPFSFNGLALGQEDLWTQFSP
jgi:hypothetical protein